jgi:hypothetical protein
MNYHREWGEYLPHSGINDLIAKWQDKQPEREQDCASPSRLMDCPRVIWLRKHNVPATNIMGWGKKQRFLLGRQLENMIAGQLKDEGVLLHHWADNFAGESDKFENGEGLDHIEGTPDLLLKLDGRVLISDSKTSRSDSFKYVPITPQEIWEDPYWYRYKLQVTAYFMLCHWNVKWFEENKLPLPDSCHLFSYALDDGIVRRELTWLPSTKDGQEVARLTRRWNEAYASETMPACTCIDDDTVKFCNYGIMPEGKKICDSCCDLTLGEGVK